MYRRLKNILGVSLMILAVVISQIPMPSAQAVETNTVTFSMNGGTFSGEYNGYNFNNRTPVLILDNNKTISAYPDEKYASYSGYETEKGKWYTDKECIEEFDQKTKITQSTTLYKRWYSRENGFWLNPDKTVLYQYDGNEKLVQIPDTVTTIADNAFTSLGNARGIVLSKNIETVYDNAFSGVNKENSIIYIYDNDSAQSRKMAQALADSYEPFVYSSYLDINKVEEIVGIDYGVEIEEEEIENKEIENKEETDNRAEEETDSKTEEDGQAEEKTENKAPQESETVSETSREYKVTFDTGIADIVGETRTVTVHSTLSELVSVAGKEAAILEKGTFSLKVENEKQEITYVFDGWYKDSACKTAWDFAKDTIEGDTTIYAKWDKDTKSYYYVTFDMNGGKYSGTYEGEEYEKIESVKTKIISGTGIQEAGYPEYPSDASFQYTGYSTDKNWYTDKNCLSKYSKTDSNGNAKEVKKDFTLYKKWTTTSSGFTMNAKKTVLYKYSGYGDVKIPTTITTIGNDAFSSVNSVTSVALPDSLTDVEEDAFSGFLAVSKEVTITAKSERAIEIARELASKYKYLVYEGDIKDEKKDSEKTSEKSASVSVLNSNESGSIEIGAKIAGSAETGSNTSTTTGAGANATSSTGIALGTSAGASTTVIGENSVTVGTSTATSVVTPAAEAATPAATTTTTVSMATDTNTAQQPVSSSSNAAAKAKTTTVSNATAASAPTGAQHIKDSTPKTGDPIQYRMLFVCILFSAGALLVLTGNGKRKKVSPS